MRIQISCDVQQRIKQVIPRRLLAVFAPEILHRTRPVNISQQTGIDQTEVVYRLASVQVEDLLQSRLFAPDLIDLMQAKDGAAEQHQEQACRDSRCCAIRLHFRLRRSKTTTAPAVTAAE